MKRTVRDLNDHVYQLADQHHVIILYKGRGMAYRHKRFITIPPIKGQVTYFVALHELGHIIGPNPSRVLDKERAAWEWALANTIVEPSPATLRSIQRYVCSHLYRAQRRRGMVVPDGFVEWVESIG